MKGLVLGALLIGLSVAPAAANYSYIQHNLIGDGIADTSFDGQTLTISANNNNLTLNDGGILTGPVTNASVLLTTTMTSYDPGLNGGAAIFSGGSFLLKFDYDGSTGQAYQIGGPVAGMVIWLGSASSYGSVLNGQALFDAGTPTLPGSGVWPDGGGLSSINSLTLDLTQDLSGWAWDSPLLSSAETQYTITPDEIAIPEPAGLLLLAVGMVGLLRRR